MGAIPDNCAPHPGGLLSTSALKQSPFDCGPCGGISINAASFQGDSPQLVGAGSPGKSPSGPPSV